MELGLITCMVHIIKHTFLTHLAKVLKGVHRLFYKRSGSSSAWASEPERGARREPKRKEVIQLRAKRESQESNPSLDACAF